MVHFDSGFYRRNPDPTVLLPYRYYTLENSVCRYETAEVLLSFAMAIFTASSCSTTKRLISIDNARGQPPVWATGPTAAFTTPKT
jgi:hypothetical protein